MAITFASTKTFCDQLENKTTEELHDIMHAVSRQSVQLQERLSYLNVYYTSNDLTDLHELQMQLIYKQFYILKDPDVIAAKAKENQSKENEELKQIVKEKKELKEKITELNSVYRKVCDLYIFQLKCAQERRNGNFKTWVFAPYNRLS